MSPNAHPYLAELVVREHRQRRLAEAQRWRARRAARHRPYDRRGRATGAAHTVRRAGLRLRVATTHARRGRAG